jgi:hypothetical protein
MNIYFLIKCDTKRQEFSNLDNSLTDKKAEIQWKKLPLRRSC